MSEAIPSLIPAAISLDRPTSPETPNACVFVRESAEK